jgi:hypothetical protein
MQKFIACAGAIAGMLAMSVGFATDFPATVTALGMLTCALAAKAAAN